ncbi:glycosyltransferase family 2 protein [bacterium]|nr:glycosyltransferase family 2 protein [bacterium]
MARFSDVKAKPKISIGIPVFNGVDYLSLAIDSILAQTYGDFELIICDNASTDNTEQLCREFAEKDDRIVYFRQPENLGASVNFITTFELARGTYFRWHGHDDMIAPTFLEELVAVLESDPGCVLVYPRTVMIDERGREKWCFLEFMACDSEDPAKRLDAFVGPPKDDYTNPQFGLLRRKAMAQTDLLAPYLASDRTFLAHMALLGRCCEIPQVLFYRREHEQMSTSANKSKRDLHAWFDGKRPLLIFKQWRLLREYLGIIHRTPMGTIDRLRCLWVLLKWMKTRGVRLLAELMLPLFINGRPTALGRFAIRTLKIKIP